MGTTMRNSRVELLRIGLIISVLFYHVVMHGFGCFGMVTDGSGKPVWWMNVCNSFFVPAVDAFVLISGYYGIKFKLKTGIGFVLQGIFYSVLVYLIVAFAFERFTIPSFVKAFFPIMTHKWWFLTNYFLIFLLSPFIELGAERIGKKMLTIIIVAYLMINSVGQYMMLTPIGSNLNTFIFLYLLGIRLRLSNINKTSPLFWSIVFFVSTIAVYATLLISCYKLNGRFYMEFLSYNNPLIILQAVSLLLIAQTMSPFYNRGINTIAKQSFAAYLFTDGALRLYINNFFATMFNWHFVLGVLSVLLLFLIICFIEYYRSKVANGIIDRFFYKLLD